MGGKLSEPEQAYRTCFVPSRVRVEEVTIDAASLSSRSLPLPSILPGGICRIKNDRIID